MKNALLCGLVLAFVNAGAAEKWVYEAKTDGAKGAVTHVAELNSATTLEGGYGAPVVLALRVKRDMSKKSDEVLLMLRNAKMECSPTDCKALIQFGDQKMQKFVLSKPRKSKGDVLQIKKAEPFLANLAKAKKLVIEVGVAGRGPKAFEFEPSPVELPARAKT